MKNSIKTRANRVRRQLARQGYRLHKSRTDGSVYVRGIYQGENINNRGGYQIVDAGTNGVVAGACFDLTLEDVMQWCTAEG